MGVLGVSGASSKSRTGFLFVLPTLLVLGALIVYPLISTIVLSVTDPRGNWVGWENFEFLATDPSAWQALVNTIIYVGGSVLLQMVLGTYAGIVLNQPFRGRGFVRSIVLIPWVIPGIVAATTWAWMYHTDFGIINYMLSQIGLISGNQGWLTNPRTVLPALIVVNTWKMVPFVAVMVMAGLQGIDRSLYEAARVDGATFVDEVRYITLPNLKPILFSTVMLLTIWGFNAFTIIYTMTGGGPADSSLIIPLHIFRVAFEFFDFNLAAAESIVLFVMLAALIGLYIRFFSPSEEV